MTERVYKKIVENRIKQELLYYFTEPYIYKAGFLKNIDLYNLASRDIFNRCYGISFQTEVKSNLAVQRFVHKGNVYWANCGTEEINLKPVIIVSERIEINENKDVGYFCVPCEENSSENIRFIGYKGHEQLFAKKSIELISEEKIHKFLCRVDYRDLNCIKNKIKDQYLNLYKKEQFKDSEIELFWENEIKKYEVPYLESKLVYPTEEEIVEIALKKLEKVKDREKFETYLRVNYIDGKPDYIFYEKENNRGERSFVVKFNPDVHDFENNLFEITFEFNNYGVLCFCPEYYHTNYVLDNYLRKKWNNLMFSKEENTEFFKVFAKYAVSIYHKIYLTKAGNTYNQEIMNEISKKILGEFRFYGILYKGDIDAAIRFGNKEFDIDLLEKGKGKFKYKKEVDIENNVLQCDVIENDEDKE